VRKHHSGDAAIHIKARRHNRGNRGSESGYALLLVLFFLALMVVAMSEAAPTILSKIQRERETEMVWRGKQYVRGIRMYYTKMKHFPTSLDELTKPQDGIRFMRQAYKDPMNLVDGSWRLIYVGPNGQLIGSLSNQTMNFSLGTAPGMGAAGATLTNALNSNSPGTFGNSTGNSTFGNSGFGNSTFGSTGFGNNQSGTTQTGTAGTTPATGSTTSNSDNGTADGTDADADVGQPYSIAGPMDASNTVGGNIIGVGSKVNKASFLVYKKAKNYKKFEFIWDPSTDIVMGVPVVSPTATLPTVNGATGSNPLGGAGAPLNEGQQAPMNPPLDVPTQQ
jgi:hypothetical protein